METKSKPRLLTPQEVARYCRVDLMTVYRWLNKGKLAGVKVGSKWRVRRRTLAEFLRPKPAPGQVEIVVPPSAKDIERRVAAADAQLKKLGM